MVKLVKLLLKKIRSKEEQEEIKGRGIKSMIDEDFYYQGEQDDFQDIQGSRRVRKKNSLVKMNMKKKPRLMNEKKVKST